MDIDDALDELYAAPPQQFVVRRGELAARLREEGDTNAAAAVKAQRKPTLAAWALNQLPRRAPDRLGTLLDAGDRLRRAQRAAMSGKGRELKQAGEEFRALVDGLAGEAAAVLEETGRSASAHVDDITATLQASAADDDVRADLAHGRLTRPAAASGFGALAGLTPVDDAAPPDEQPAPARGEQRELRRRLRSARDELAAQQRAEGRHQRRAEDAERRAERLARQAEEARAEAEEARERAARAAADTQGARQAVADAERRVADLDGGAGKRGTGRDR